ncbi:malectin domain-containing carbohydrate-binding protein [Cystobacter ferrugineus]|uniref:Malectin domain-containing protein n=1 Tax=Cystobacter ferrugineus TaxID=83449 RepID=A0A1L9BGN7_9BACT|nr:malectin domain-containing carbohydrate-binding protein [Cystobacter ferrugineus]OJH41427.1 hypothetical protein BON30_11265 [Cystobacter ferrugineus]
MPPLPLISNPSLPSGRLLGVLPLLGALLLAPGCAPESVESPRLQQVEQSVVTLPIRINVGGEAYTDSTGKVWDADWGFSGGSPLVMTQPISGTEEDPLYQSARTNGQFSYTLPVPGPGVYRVDLHFADELGPGFHTFDISAEEGMYVEGFDLGKEAGTFNAYTVSLDVMVDDGQLVLEFGYPYGYATLSAIEVKRSSWQALGGLLTGAANTSFPREPAMAVDAMSRPTAAWVESVHPESGSGYVTNQLVVRRWSGSQWLPVGGALGSPEAGNVISPSLVLDASGRPLVTFYQPYADSISVFWWNGTVWLEMPPVIVPDMEVPEGISLALTPSGYPVVAIAVKSYFSWSSYDTQPRVYVYQWNGLAWTQQGAALESGTGLGAARNPSLAIDRYGRAVVAWDAYDDSNPYLSRGTVHVFRYEAGQWGRLGGVLNHTPENEYAVAENPSLVVDPIDGTPSVAWIDEARNTVNRRIFVARWSAANGAWSQLTDDGLDGWVRYATDAYGPALAAGRDGSLVVTWNERTQRGTPHFLRKWSGGQWSAFASNPHAMMSSNYFVDSALALDVRDQPLLMSPINPWANSPEGFYVRQFVP